MRFFYEHRLVYSYLTHFVGNERVKVTPELRVQMKNFFDTTDFPFLKVLEDGWQDILKEGLALSEDDLMPYPVEEFYNRGWWVCGLFSVDYPGASAEELEPWLARNRELCPKTTALVSQLPDNQLAGFSILEPGCEMEPHVHDDGYHICHLGLVIPGGSGIKVRDETRVWEEGKCFAFHETAEHYAWNHGKTRRLIFLADFDPKAMDQDS